MNGFIFVSTLKDMDEKKTLNKNYLNIYRAFVLNGNGEETQENGRHQYERGDKRF